MIDVKFGPMATIVALGIWLLSSPAAALERRVALVIGNGAYEHTTPLRNPTNDAADVAAALKRLGFDVVVSTNATGAALAEVLSNFTKLLQGADVALLFYAGHGVQFGGRNHLLPIDARLSNEFALRREAIAVDDVLASMEAQARTSIVFLDACRNNPLAEQLQRSLKGSDRSGVVTRGLARMELRGGNTLVAYATAPGEVAEDGQGRNSPFVEALLRHIETPGVDIEVVMKDVTSDVRQATRNRQKPERLSRLEGKLVLKGGPGPAGTAARIDTVDPGRDERLYWESVRESNDAAQIQAYLARYPQGLFADIASAKLRQLAARLTLASPAPPPATSPVDTTMHDRITRFVEFEYLQDKEHFAERVDYYDKGIVALQYILDDRRKYAAKWPSRQYKLIPGSLSIARKGANEHIVTFRLSYTVANGATRRDGQASTQILLRESGSSFLVAAVKEIASR